MRSFWRILVRCLFWSYERGSWPYDLMVVAIVLFVLLTPRRWFHDQPQLSPSPSTSHIALVRDDSGAGKMVYRVDIPLLVPPMRPPELERKTHDLLGKNVPELKGRTFQIEHIEPVLGEDDTILGYEVTVKR